MKSGASIVMVRLVKLSSKVDYIFYLVRAGC